MVILEPPCNSQVYSCTTFSRPRTRYKAPWSGESYNQQNTSAQLTVVDGYILTPTPLTSYIKITLIVNWNIWNESYFELRISRLTKVSENKQIKLLTTEKLKDFLDSENWDVLKLLQVQENKTNSACSNYNTRTTPPTGTTNRVEKKLFMYSTRNGSEGFTLWSISKW